MTDREAIRAGVRAVLRRRRWLCDAGHEHQRPEPFSMRDVQNEVNRRNPRNGWDGASVACAVFDLIESGELEYDPDETLRLRVPA